MIFGFFGVPAQRFFIFGDVLVYFWYFDWRL